MMKQIYVVLFCLIAGVSSAQEYLQRSTLGMSGSSSKVVVGDAEYYVSSSVGQRSVIGTISKDGYTMRQGFQQPPIRVVATATANESTLNTAIYPNPVSNFVTVQFGNAIESDILTLLYDIQGREVINSITPAVQSFQLDMSSLAAGTYILKIRVKSETFSTRLIKN